MYRSEFFEPPVSAPTPVSALHLRLGIATYPGVPGMRVDASCGVPARVCHHRNSVLWARTPALWLSDATRGTAVGYVDAEDADWSLRYLVVRNKSKRHCVMACRIVGMRQNMAQVLEICNN